MVRLAELTEAMQASVTGAPCQRFDGNPWVAVDSLADRTVAIVSSAGLALANERPFRGGENGYREIPHNAPASDVMMSHISVNYDRVGYQLDLELVLPRQRLNELADENVIGNVADTHYSFMGATDPAQMEGRARELGRRMVERGVDTALLLPV